MATQNQPQDDDIKDSKSDEERLKPDEGTIDLPDVKDIPGQEFVHVPSMGELADTTISSDDEEDVTSGDASLDDGNPAEEEDDTLGIP